MFFEEFLKAGDDDFVPAEEDLAFFVANGGLHGFEAALPAHARYWQRQMPLAWDRVEPAREDLASWIWSWLTLNGKGPADYNLNRITNATPEDREGWRRTILGGLAMSMMLRRGMSSLLEGPIIDGRGTGELHRGTGKLYHVPDMSLEKTEREWPYEPRLHIVTNESPAQLNERDTWTRQGRLLICFRYPADVTPPMVAFLEERDLDSIDLHRAFTIMPHLIALHSPQFG